MAKQNKTASFGEKIREALEKLGDVLDEWLARQSAKPQPVPIPIDRPHRKRQRSRN